MISTSTRAAADNQRDERSRARRRRWRRLQLVMLVVTVLAGTVVGASVVGALRAPGTDSVAAGLAFARRPGEKSAGAVAAELRRHLGRRRAVEQE